jgi:peptide/nickel transport system permease protein
MVLGGLIVLMVISAALAAPWLAPFSPARQDLFNRLQPPSIEHWLGTDQFGRDVLSRLLYGARISMVVGVAAVAIGAAVGTVLGATAGYFGGWVDTILSRIIDGLMAFPMLLMALLVVAILGAGVENTMLAIGIATSPRFARLLRSEVLQLKEREFVEAARALGSGHAWTLVRHILPHLVSSVIVLSTLRVAAAILTEANLSFLGLGVQPPTPSWGGMISTGRQYIVTAYWVPLIPGVTIAITVLGFNLFGDGLRDHLDPRLQGRE